MPFVSWYKTPFVRLLIPFIGGIVLQWQLQIDYPALIVAFSSFIVLVLLYFLLPLKVKYRLSSVNGVVLNLLLVSTAAILVWQKDIRHDSKWIGHFYKDSSTVLVTIEEPLVEKANSYKALSSIQGFYSDTWKVANGNAVLYFKKDSILPALHYGSQIILTKPLQEIKNAGNPGSFDYNRYSLFQGITHQVYLTANDFEILPGERIDLFAKFIFDCRKWVVLTLKKFIAGEKEQGFAEALLIGYKDDLDKNLVQSYTNTGVVHIIAISGMHLALIYGLLVLLTKPISKKRKLKWLRIILILSGLWLFTLLAGAQASVVRSAVMFTCIALGEVLSRRTSIYNTLALSAFLLLCYNPFWLWDVGFQLSYAAVVSIVTFYKPIYNWVYFPNKSLDFIWKTMAISIAAQILTTPISLYHFHQFPVLFLLTNLVAVPLSSLILFGEIFLCCFSWLTPVANVAGKIISLFIYWMNSYIERIELVPFSLWNGFSITLLQTVFLSVALVAICFWLMEKKKWMLWFSLTSLFLFVCIRSWFFYEVYHQRKLIVYNVPKHAAIDLVIGRTYNFIGDSNLLYDDFIRNFHIQPSRVLHRMKPFQTIPIGCKDLKFCNKKIIVIDSSITFITEKDKLPIDVLILSKNPKIYISGLVKTFEIKQVVIDGSVPGWKSKYWKRDCDSLHIPCFDVSEKGAFVMNL